MDMPQRFDFAVFQKDTWFEMQMAVKKAREAKHNPEATNLMELGFLPGHSITPGHSAPGGDPRVFRVDGSEVALRRETARKLILRKV